MEDSTVRVVKVIGFDHVVLIVEDTERSLRWYRDVLGLAAERLAEWQRGEAPFVSVRIDSTTVIDLVEGDVTGRNVDHVCLVVAGVTDLGMWAAGAGLPIVEGPARRWGAQGWATSVYVHDPDGHLVEIRTYPAGS